MPEQGKTKIGADPGERCATPRDSGFRLNRRHFSNTLVRIGGVHYPRRSLMIACWEGLAILSLLLIATCLRWLHWPATQQFLADRHNWYRFAVVTIVYLLSFYFNDLYDFRATRNLSTLFLRAAAAQSTSLLVLAILFYLFPLVRLERGIVLLVAPLTWAFVVIFRRCVYPVRSLARSAERILILGAGSLAEDLVQAIQSRPELQYEIVGFLSGKGEVNEERLEQPGIAGSYAQLEEIVERQRIDRVVICLDERRGVLPFLTMATLKLQGLPIEDAESVYERITGRIMVDRMRLSSLILSDGFRKSQFLVASKRIGDIVISSILIILTLPIMLVIALVLLLEDGAPIFFRQERTGLGTRTFQILKFRSMRHGSGAGRPQWTADGDPRITRVGRFLRRYRLDELPQFINILRGDMSLVGPRPEVPYFCELLDKEIRFFNQRHVIRPGLTGWAQVKYRYGATLEEAKTKFEFDFYYLKHMSIMLDLAILIETAKVVIRGRGAK